MKKLFLILSPLFLLCLCQEPPVISTSEIGEDQVCRIMFWNSENLFDCYNDTTILDDEFLPHGLRGWNNNRYNQKIKNMYKVIIAAGDWDPPDLIGLCEVENKNVIFDLIRNSEFAFFDYRFIHHDSPDRRGIDVALLYNPAKIEVLEEKAINVKFPDDPGSRTRDILFVRVKIKTGDTLSLFVNHWPSKYGGAGVTADLRETVAGILMRNIQDLRKRFPAEKIIVVGDLNDPPESTSVETLSKSKPGTGTADGPVLVNLGMNYKGTIPGSYKFEGAWELIDQILVSENLVKKGSTKSLKAGSFRVFSPAFLLENDDRFGGSRPFRTYAGVVYQGGYSDHLPVVLDLFVGP